jgi:hypothetical protein
VFTVNALIINGERIPTIYFEQTPLPQWAKLIDIVVVNQSIPELPEDLIDWWWRFPICADRWRSAKSDEIIAQTTALERVLKHHEIEVIHEIETRFNAMRIDASKIHAQWMQTVELMRAIASDQDECSWIGRLPEVG